jgi:molybdate transport system substrate-binding protein
VNCRPLSPPARTALRWATLLVALALPGGAALADVTPRPLVVFAAASLRPALDEIAAGWQRETGQAVRVSYAGTPALARQVEQGAPADVFVSADREWMQYLSTRGLVAEPVALLGNRLVLVTPRDSRVTLRLTQAAPLAAALGGGRLAVANVQSVPAGRYARAALQSLGLWASVADRLVQTADVRAALRLVARGEAPLGIVYATDARAEPAVRAVDVFPADSHPPIVYMVAAVAGSTHPGAAAFITALAQEPARAAFVRQGFEVLGGGGPG